MTATTFSITALCREFEVTPRTLRFYEGRGLLSPTRAGQARLYSPRDRARLGLILRGRRLGFSLDEIAELIELYDPADGGAAQLDRSLVAVEARIAQLSHRKAEIELVLAELKAVRMEMEKRRAQLALDPQHPKLPSAEDYDRLLRPRVDGDSAAHVRSQ